MYRPGTAGSVPGTVEASLICRLYGIGARTEPRGIPASVFLGIENLPPPNALNVLSLEKKQLSLLRLVEKSNSYNL